MSLNGHTHDWRPNHVESDDYVYVYETCDYVEIRNAVTCDRLDETFYEEGPSCDAHRKHTFAVDWDAFPVSYDEDPDTHDHLVRQLEAEVAGDFRVSLSPGDDLTVTLRHNGEPVDVAVTFEHTERLE